MSILPDRWRDSKLTYGKSSGTGLGLAISKAVVEAHHGSIAVKTSDRGTSFRIDLPLSRNVLARVAHGARAPEK
jgi:signal transduction histidine kinase